MEHISFLQELSQLHGANLLVYACSPLYSYWLSSSLRLVLPCCCFLMLGFQVVPSNCPNGECSLLGIRSWTGWYKEVMGPVSLVHHIAEDKETLLWLSVSEHFHLQSLWGPKSYRQGSFLFVTIKSSQQQKDRCLSIPILSIRCTYEWGICQLTRHS